MSRDNFTRCKHCGRLWSVDQCILSEKDGYKCPNGCEESFEQPPYQSPLQDE